MPIQYSKYAPNWKSEIRPAVLARANNCCEEPGCGLRHKQYAYRALVDGQLQWFAFREQIPAGADIFKKGVKVIITIAHLDHNETDHSVTIDRLRALCQLHHLRYDKEEKKRRRAIASGEPSK